MTDIIQPTTTDQLQQTTPEVKQKRKYTVDPNNKPGPTPMIERLYKTVEAFDKKVFEYFNGAAYKRKVVTQLGVEVEIPTPTISDLVLFLGFTDRKSFSDHENHPLFGASIKRAKTMIEREYENLLRHQSCTGAIFALKNFGWIDRREYEHSGEVKGNETRIIIINNKDGSDKYTKDISVRADRQAN